MSRLIEMKTDKIDVLITSGELLFAVDRRDWLHIRNDGANTVHVRFGTAAAVADETSIKIVSGGELIVETPGTEAIQAIALVATVSLTITTNECNF